MGKSDSDSSSLSGKRQTKAQKQRKMVLDAVPGLVKIIDDDIGEKTIKKFSAALAKVYDKAHNHKPTVNYNLQMFDNVKGLLICAALGMLLVLHMSFIVSHVNLSRN